MPSTDNQLMQYQVIIKANAKFKISNRIKENLQEIILEPQTTAIFEEGLAELCNNTSDRIHTYILDNEGCNLVGDIAYY